MPTKCAHFLSIDPKARYQEVRAKNVCMSCLQTGHCAKQCAKRCTVVADTTLYCAGVGELMARWDPGVVRLQVDLLSPLPSDLSGLMEDLLSRVRSHKLECLCHVLQVV